MSALTCPLCQGILQEMNREGVMIDVCSKCRGVWLDRGELDKLIGMVRDSYPSERDYPRRERVPDHDWRGASPPRYHDDDDDRHRHAGHYGKSPYRKKSKLESIFDIFD